MVETISELSVALGVPFISGKDSSSGTFQTAGRQIDVPPTLVVAAMGRLPDVSKVVTKEFKRPGHRLVLVGKYDCEALGGGVYADSLGQRGDRLFDAYDANSIRRLWDTLLRLHKVNAFISASAIAEGGIFLRIFEAAWGSGYGAQINLDAFSTHAGAPQGVHVRSPRGRKDGAIFGEFVGSVLLEVSSDFNLNEQFGDVNYLVIGEVLPDPQLVLRDQGDVVWRATTAALGDVWSKTFREVIE